MQRKADRTEHPGGYPECRPEARNHPQPGAKRQEFPGDCSQERLDGEEKRFQAGLSQNYLVLQRQNELSSAEYTYLQALINYKKSIITLQKAMYTLLESNEFEIAKGSSEQRAESEVARGERRKSNATDFTD